MTSAQFHIFAPTLKQVEEAVRRTFPDRQIPADLYDKRSSAAYVRTGIKASTNFSEPRLESQLWNSAKYALLGTAAYNLTSDVNRNLKVGPHLLEVWLGELDIGWRFSVSRQEMRDLECVLSQVPPAPRCAEAPVLDWVGNWVLNALMDPHRGSLGQVLGVEIQSEPVRAFIACAMSDPPDDEVEQLLGVSDSFARILSAAGILCYQPLLTHDPRKDREAADHPSNRTLNERQIASCDLVIVIADRPAYGLGVVDSFALKYGAHIVLVSGGLPISPMIVGSVPPPFQIALGPDATSEFKEYLSSNMIGLRHESLERREAQRRARVELNAYRDRLAGLSIEQLERHRKVRMARERFRQLISDADLFDGMSHREYRVLMDLVDDNVPLPELTFDELRALYRAEFELGWDTSLTPEIARIGRGVLVSGKQRFEPENFQFWIEMYRRLKAS
jgi:hypothetical protein